MGLSNICNISLDKNKNSYFIIAYDDASALDAGIGFQKEQLFFTNLIKNKPNYETGYIFRGLVNSQSKFSNNDGFKDFKTALELNPNNMLANIYMSWTLSKKYDFSGEMEKNSKLFEIEPNRVIEAIKIDGSELNVLFDYIMLYKAYIECSKSKKLRKFISSKLTKLYVDKEYKEIITLCDELINKSQQKTHAFYYRGIANLQLKKYDDALADFNHVIDINPNVADAFAMRGELELSTNELNSALLDLNKAIELDDNDGYMYYKRALVKNKLEDKNNACLDLKKAIDLNFSDANSLLNEICK